MAKVHTVAYHKVVIQYSTFIISTSDRLGYCSALKSSILQGLCKTGKSKIGWSLYPNPEIFTGNDFLATQRKTIPTMEGCAWQRCWNEAFLAIASRKKKENK